MTYKPKLEILEYRNLMSIMPLTTQGINPQKVQMIRHAYNFDAIWTQPSVYNREAGKGVTIAIVDAFSDSNIFNNLNIFCSHYNIPKGNLSIAYPLGTPSYDIGWGFEESLDIEWARAIAPAARILYIGVPDASSISMLVGVQYAVNHSNIVSLSWGTPAFTNDKGTDFFLQPDSAKQRVAITASAGDTANQLYWPAHDRYALSIGGTTLNDIAGSGRYLGERLWPDSGRGGLLAYDSDPFTGFPTVVTYNNQPTWGLFGGTSDASPQWAGVLAITDQKRRENHLAFLSTLDVKNFLPKISKSDFHHGHNIPGFGSPIANKLVPDLAKAKSLPQIKRAFQAPINNFTVVPLFEVSYESSSTNNRY